MVLLPLARMLEVPGCCNNESVQHRAGASEITNLRWHSRTSPVASTRRNMLRGERHAIRCNPCNDGTKTKPKSAHNAYGFAGDLKRTSMSALVGTPITVVDLCSSTHYQM